MFVTSASTASAASVESSVVSIPIANTQPKSGGFWQIVRNVAPPWNSKYGSCSLPGSRFGVFFGGAAATNDAWLCDARPPAQSSGASPLWTKLSIVGDVEAPAPRLFPLMTGLGPDAFILAGGAGLSAPWTSFTDAYVGRIDAVAATISWETITATGASAGTEFAYEHSDHAPLATTSAFMRSVEGVLISVTPSKASALAHVRGIENPGEQKNTLVVTVYTEAPGGGVGAQYHLVKYAPAPFAGEWPSSDLQSVRLVPLLDGFAFGYVVPRTKEYAEITGASTWILWVSCAGLETGTPAIRYKWTNIGGFRNAPTLRSGAAIFHSRANTPNGAMVGLYGGSAIWTPRANAAEVGVLPTVSDQGRSLLPLNVGLFTKNSDGSFSFIWQNPYVRQTPPVASDQPMWDGDVVPAEAPAFQLANIDTMTVGFVHYGGFWRSPTTNATTITVVSVPRAALIESVSLVGGDTQPAVRFFVTGEAFALPNVARIS